jgi:predicted ester cyclase
MKVDKTLVDGDYVTVLWSGEGTNTGEGNGLPATGKKLKGRGITIWRISGGKIREEWSEFDQLRILQQLGLMQPPAPK